MAQSMEATSAAAERAAREWLLSLQDCVRRVDYEAGRRLFAEDVVAFGSRAGTLLHGLDALQAHQWSGVWPVISDFSFSLDQLDCRGQGEVTLVVVPWASIGYRAEGTSFERPGRATVVLAHRDGAWLAVHTHFSLVPPSPAV